MAKLILPGRNDAIVPAGELMFNFLLALPGRASSPHTQRAYFRWVDQYLCDVAGLKPTTGDARLHRMQNLPVAVLQASLSAAQFRAWLGMLARSHGKQGIGQALAAVVTLASLLAEAGLLALAGITFGGLLGWALSAYFGRVGIYFGDLGISNEMLLTDRIYTYLTLDAAVNLIVTAFVITLLASLYPARMASRMEPVEALHKAQ